MNWEAVGAIAELLGALGVILTLIFLIIQIRQNTRAVRAASYQASVAPISALSLEFATNKEAAELLIRGGMSPETLSAMEWARFSAACVALLRNFDNIYHQYKAGMFDEGVWQGWEQAMLAQFTQPGVQRFYAENKSRYSPEFQKFLAEARPSDLKAAIAFGGTPPRPSA